MCRSDKIYRYFWLACLPLSKKGCSKVPWHVGYIISYTRHDKQKPVMTNETSNSHRLHQTVQTLKWTNIFIILSKLPKCSSLSEVTSARPYILTSPLLRQKRRALPHTEQFEHTFSLYFSIQKTWKYQVVACVDKVKCYNSGSRI